MRTALFPPVLRILLAEDNEVNQQVATLMLSRLGHSTDLAANGQEALEAVRAGDYDVVLMDLHMPVMGGLEATRSIRLLAHNQPRIVALTASTSSEKRAACLAAGMDGYLNTPVHLGDLASALAVAARPPSGGQTPEEGLERGVAPALTVGGRSRPGDRADAGGDATSSVLADDDVADCLAGIAERMREVFEGDDSAAAQAIEARMTASFCERAPILIDLLEAAALGSDVAAVSYRAHALSGMAGNLGATTMAALAATLGKRAGMAGPGEVAARVDRLRTLSDGLVARLQPGSGRRRS